MNLSSNRRPVSQPTTTPRLLRSAIRLLATFLAATGVTVASAAIPAMAAETAPSWDLATADGPHGTARQNYDYAAAAGDRLDDAMTVVNTGTAPIDLELYAADAFTTASGRLDLRTRTNAPTGVGAWLALERGRISLGAGESAEIPFTITIPRDAKGDYVGGIVTTRGPSSGDDAERRAAIRVALHVGGLGRPSLSVEDLSVEYSGGASVTGDATVTYTVRNSGDTTLAAEQSVAVAGPLGAFSGTADPLDNLPQLLPGETWSVSVPVHDVPAVGPITVTVTVVPLYTDPAGSTGPLTAIETPAIGWAIPWLPLLLLLGLGVLAFVAFWRMSRGRRG
jgi:hypothetical protein